MSLSSCSASSPRSCRSHPAYAQVPADNVLCSFPSTQRERHFDGNAAMSHLTIPGRSMQPLCYFLGEKVTQKHFHTDAPLGRQYESAFARSRGGCWWWSVRCIRSSQPPPEGRCPCRLRAAPLLDFTNNLHFNQNFIRRYFQKH